jgi:hypothetical protein
LRFQAAQGEALVESFGIVANELDIVHGWNRCLEQVKTRL